MTVTVTEERLLQAGEQVGGTDVIWVQKKESISRLSLVSLETWKPCTKLKSGQSMHVTVRCGPVTCCCWVQTMGVWGRHTRILRV